MKIINEYCKLRLYVKYYKFKAINKCYKLKLLF